MGLFKSETEKRKNELEKIKKDWQKTSEHKLGISYDDAGKIEKVMSKALIDAVNDEGLISDCSVIQVLFPDLTPEQKTLILYYGRWVDSVDFKYPKM